MSTDNIIVNDFMFCTAHGDEYCYACTCDHRMCNNIRIEDDLGELSEFFEFAIEERQPINVYALGAVAAIQTESSYQCEKHKKIDCGTCFDWVSIVKHEAEAAQEHGRWLARRTKWMDRIEE